jgi:23S rRNA G2445 N2-methylase RlmL
VPRHLGTDIDPRCVSSGERNAERAGVETTVSFAESDAAVAELPCGERDALLVLCNPPYGDRMRGAIDPLRRLRERLFARRAPTALVMLAPRGLAEGYLARGGRVVAEIRNGGIPVVLLAWSNRDEG